MSNTNWLPATWDAINAAVSGEMNIRTAQQVIHPEPATTIQNEEIDIKNLSIPDTGNKAFIEIFVEFSLSATQFEHEEDALKTCRTLARIAAKEIALAEDSIIYTGNLPDSTSVQLSAKLDSAAIGGLLSKVGETIQVDPLDDEDKRPGLRYGENVFTAVADGIARLTSKAQAPDFALVLPTNIFSDTFVPPGDGSLVTTAERLKALAKGGFFGTNMLPPDKGLLIAQGGGPVVIYIGHDAKVTGPTREDHTRQIFNVIEQFQFTVRDPRALVALQFN